MSQTFQPGDIAMCVSDRSPFGNGPSFTKGKTYTVRKVDAAGDPIMTIEPESEVVGYSNAFEFHSRPGDAAPVDPRKAAFLAGWAAGKDYAYSDLVHDDAQLLAWCKFDGVTL